MTLVDPKSAHRGTSRSRSASLELVCVGLVVAAAFVLRFWGLSRMHFWDENVYLLNAEYFAFGKAGYMEIDSRPPLLSLIFACVFRVWHSDYAALAVTAMMNAVGPAFLYLAGTRIVGRVAAAIAGLFLAFGPHFVGVCPDGYGGFGVNCNGHGLLSDCPALTLLVISLWLLLRALEKQTDLRFACAGCCLAMTVLMRFGSLSSIGLLSLLVLAAHHRARAAAACAAGFVLGIAPYLCWSRLHYGGYLRTIRNGWANLDGPSEPFFFYLKNVPGMFSWLAIAGLVLWSINWGLELWSARRRAKSVAALAHIPAVHRLRWEGFLWLWASVVVLFFSSLSHKETRYAIPVAPPLLLLAGSGLSSLVKSKRAEGKAIGASVLAGALLVVFWPDHHRFDSGFFDNSVSDEMTVAEFLKHNLPPNTVLYANENFPDFAYYSGMTVQYLPERGDELYKALKKLPADGILIAYKENDDNVPPEPPLTMLDADPHFGRWQEFSNVVLYKYHAF